MLWCSLIKWWIKFKITVKVQQHSLLESRRVAVDAASAQVVDKGQVFGDVRHRPATEEAVQQALVPSWQSNKDTLLNSPKLISNGKKRKKKNQQEKDRK